ncbi:hypothetical protein [Phage f2b1]|nr:hypothetical protein [Phage f2b1]
MVRHRTLTACIVGSSPASVTNLLGYSSVVERLTVNQDVAGSIPATSAKIAEMVELGYTPDLGSGALSGMGVRVSLSAPSLQRGRYSVRFHKPDSVGSTPTSVTIYGCGVVVTPCIWDAVTQVRFLPSVPITVLW